MLKLQQAEIYFPNIASSQFGIVRAYQKDANDTDSSGALFVDSDGMVAQDARAVREGASNVSTARVAPVNGMNSLWHMVTLTSQPDGQAGYRRARAP